MQVIITGAAGFLGQLLAKKLLTTTSIDFTEILLVDIVEPPKPLEDGRIKCLKLDLTTPNSAQLIIMKNTKLVFHLAAIVSGHAEKDFDLGWHVNVDSTRFLLEACRQMGTNIGFVFASSCAVFGGALPAIVNDTTALNPSSSYGAQKSVCELMVNDYARKGYILGISIRLPTICVRPGKANQAASSFVSGIIREPLNNQIAICPVDPKLAVWISSPETIINNFVIAAKMLPENKLTWRSVNLPGIKVTVNQMIASLQKLTSENIIEKIKFEIDETINRLVVSWPTEINNDTAIDLGFEVDANFDDFIINYCKSEGIQI
jgi:nucleoside-diphosphate-sugar epimerase